jgi:hypothetical protein
MRGRIEYRAKGQIRNKGLNDKKYSRIGQGPRDGF